MRIILIRHTESIGNKMKVYAGSTDYELTEYGITQIHVVVNQLERILDKESIYNLFSSPLQRCTILSEEIGKSIGVEKHIDNRLSETNFGLFEGKTYNDLINEFPEILDKWNKDIIHFQIPKGESLIMCEERISSFCEELKWKNEDSIIVSHGGIIKLILLNLLNLDINHFWKFFTSNGCIIEIEHNEGFGYLKNIIQL
ncbi:histidine phosphatase family protein [Bacillus sp. EAC]|uniref:histidine phosphatase family protein n=1 Tax=Bacillus sp. EAC TaxID=1978338 RepID=UPI0015C4F541|nr:histidine phosphatase family protein [Bacillus sp. EAC]